MNRDGKYKNLDGHSVPRYRDAIKWKLFQKNKYAEQRKNQKSNVEVIKDKAFLSVNDGITWMGHATFLFSLGGTKILTDPLFYDIWPLKRFTDLPCDVADLTGLDCILLSHNHRDHADKRSMKAITELNPQAVIYTGLEIEKLLRSWGVKNKIVEAGWYQKLPELDNRINIHYLPAKHWNRRLLTDYNEMLWGSFMISYKNKNLYFGADSGLGSHFETIGNLFDIDLCLLGIGAYEPLWIMKGSHTSPSDALQAMQELNASNMIPMHYGTFDLSDEPIFNPKDVLKELSKDRNDIHINEIGQSWWF